MIRASVLLALFVALPATAQVPFWTEASRTEAPSRPDLTEYRVVRVDVGDLRTSLMRSASSQSGLVMQLPLPEGGAATVTLTEAPVMPSSLQARYPAIRTYIARGSVNGRLAVTPRGLSGLLYDADGALVIDPLGQPSARAAELYAVYRTTALQVSEDLIRSLSDDLVELDLHTDARPDGSPPRPAPIGETVRTYRLAVATTGEYTESRGGSAADALAAVAASVNRVNALFERDLAVRFVLVENNDQILYEDPDTDPFDPVNDPDIFAPIQATIDNVIGEENYDLGHLIMFDLDGQAAGAAGLGVACIPGLKALGFSSVRFETTPFDLLVFPHELGHQLGAEHAFVQPSDVFFEEPQGVEPGPGYTMMSYPHFALYRPSDQRIGYHFHSASIASMDAYVRGPGGTCGTDIATENDVPVVTVENSSITIPLGAFFTLRGDATDASGTPLTYAWEQIDPFGDGTGAIPRIRALDPSPDPTRTIPDLPRFLDGRPYQDELPLDLEATYSFRLTVRDNVPGGGAQAGAVTRVNVRTADGPFEITSVAAGTVYQAGDAVEVTWNVAGSDSDEIGAATVDMLVSTDNGETWTPAATAVPNDGSETVTMPTTPTAAGRLMVRATDAPFFTVAAEPFALSSVVAAADDATPDAVTVSPVWPNPATAQARVQVRLDAPMPLRATVYDALGRAVAIVNERGAAGTVTMPLEVGALAAGVYLLRIEGATFVETRRFVVAR